MFIPGETLIIDPVQKGKQLKKHLLVTLVALFLILPVAQASADTKVGLGYHGTFIGEFFNGLSLRAWFGALGADLTLYNAEIKPDGGDDVQMYMFDGRFMYAPIIKENSRFYLGLNLAYGKIDLDYSDIDVLTYGVMIGAEYNFKEIPEIGFNWEVGYKNSNLDEDNFEIDLRGISVAFGVHYYF
jgi:hypothetical protein